MCFQSGIYSTSRFAASSCGGLPVALRPSSFATHAHRKHLKTSISENTLIYSGNQTNAHIHIFLLESNKVVYPCCVTIFPLDFKQHYSLKTKPSASRDAAGTRPIIFSIKSYLCVPKAGSHSIQGMAGHSRQTPKQKFLCFISIDTISKVPYLYTMLISVNNFNLITFTIDVILL